MSRTNQVREIHTRDTFIQCLSYIYEGIVKYLCPLHHLICWANTDLELFFSIDYDEKKNENNKTIAALERIASKYQNNLGMNI